MFEFDYKSGLYRRNNYGEPTVWSAVPYDINSIIVYHGIVGKTIASSIIRTTRDTIAECDSRINAKRKQGYKFLSEIKDNVSIPVEESLYDYLNLYLPDYRTTADGALLPMLAKVFDNENNKVFKKCSQYYGQWKINGLRCFVRFAPNDCDLFKKYKCIFQSREGTIWNSLDNLEDYLINNIDEDFIKNCIDNNWILDGEVYLPGHTVNEINHFVKDVNCPENKLIQYWCYDIAIEDTNQYDRNNILYMSLYKDIAHIDSKQKHLENTSRFLILPTEEIVNEQTAIVARDKYIDLGFEGLIMRNPDAEYQYGKRNMSMIKYKRATDGKFTIIDIYPEGIARKDIPILLLKNDINECTFETHLNGTQEYQSSVLRDKYKYIGKSVFLEYGERSGVNQVPFHIKGVTILK